MVQSSYFICNLICIARCVHEQKNTLAYNVAAIAAIKSRIKITAKNQYSRRMYAASERATQTLRAGHLMDGRFYHKNHRLVVIFRVRSLFTSFFFHSHYD